VGIRESMNQNPKIVTGVTVAVIVLALLYIFLSNRSGGVTGSTIHAKAYYSTDDGKTYFADDAKNVPPFQKDGKEAVRAYVFKCPDGKKFVAHLERYTLDAKKKIEAVQSGSGGIGDPTVLETIQMTGVEIKAPGQPKWIKQSDPRAGAVLTPKCSSGGQPEPVLPE
jgi:hypothetical protein